MLVDIEFRGLFSAPAVVAGTRKCVVDTLIKLTPVADSVETFCVVIACRVLVACVMSAVRESLVIVKEGVAVL